jgi:hypothetical protein
MADDIWASFGTMPGGDEEIGAPACMDRALTYLSEQDQRKIRKGLENRAGDPEQVQHLFREVLAGVFLGRRGFTMQYEPKIKGQTPDWHFKSDGVGEFISEFRNLESAEKISVEQARALDESGPGLWSGILPENTDRLWSAMLKKASKYKKIANEMGLPYVMIVHGLFTSCLRSGEVEKSILPSNGLFAEYPELSGVYHMRERVSIDPKSLSVDQLQKLLAARPSDADEIKQMMKPLAAQALSDPAAGYRFDFYSNPKATRPTPWLTNGLLPYRFPACGM